MRLFFISLLILLSAFKVSAQIPEKMSYQAIVRSSDNSLVSDSNVTLRFIVRQGSEDGTNTYEETHSATTNANGLVSLEIGTGNIVSGDFSKIPWSNGPFFIETQVDPTGGSNYSIIGVSQLLSVPYALTAKYAENVIGANGSQTNRADIISVTSSRNVNSSDINNTMECTNSATLTIPEGFTAMKVGDIINLEAHNGALLTVKGTQGVQLNYVTAGTATFESSTGNVRFGLLRKISSDSYIVSGQYGLDQKPINEDNNNPEENNDPIPEEMEKPESTDAEPESDNLILMETFDGTSLRSTADGGFYPEFAANHSFSINETIKRQGKSSGRFEIRKDDPKIWGGTRAEISQPKKLAKSEGWYGFSLYFPDSYASDPVEEIIGQWHDVTDDGEATDRSPSNSIIVQNDKFKWMLRWDANKITINNKPEDIIYLDLGKVPKAEWIDWVVHIKYASDNTGILEVWKDGVKVVDRQNMPNSYNDDNYPYFKLGIYKWAWGSVDQKTIYWDEVRIGNEKSSFNEVKPGQ